MVPNSNAYFLVDVCTKLYEWKTRAYDLSPVVQMARIKSETQNYTYVQIGLFFLILDPFYFIRG